MKPDVQILVKMSLSEITDAIAVLHPEGHSVVLALVRSSPAGHYNSAFQEALTGEILTGETKKRILAKVDENVRSVVADYKAEVSEFRT